MLNSSGRMLSNLYLTSVWPPLHRQKLERGQTTQTHKKQISPQTPLTQKHTKVEKKQLERANDHISALVRKRQGEIRFAAVMADRLSVSTCFQSLCYKLSLLFNGVSLYSYLSSHNAVKWFSLLSDGKTVSEQRVFIIRSLNYIVDYTVH